PREGPDRLAHPTPGEHPHHQRDREAARPSHGTSHPDRPRAWQYLGRVGTDGSRYRDPGRSHQTRRPAAARGFRRGLHVGREPHTLLTLDETADWRSYSLVPRSV